MMLTPEETVQRIDLLLSHVWMVRTFIKHSEEAEEDDELAEVHRVLYDYMLSLGEPLHADDVAEYLKRARKKLAKLQRAKDAFVEIQPEISGHMNFQMAARSVSAAVDEIGELLESLSSGMRD